MLKITGIITEIEPDVFGLLHNQ